MAAAATLTARVRLAGRGLGDLELAVPPGVTVLFGPSGAGKSSLLQVLAGLLRPDAGQIVLGNQVWFDSARRIDRAPERRQVAYVFQSLALFPHLTAAGNVMYGMPRATPSATRAAQARALLARLGVGHLAARRPRTYSGGEAQRVALARALARQPRLVLLDEPFSALDRALRVELAGLVRDLVDELAVPMLFVTHDHDEARAVADQVVRLQGGRIVDRGPPQEVLGAAPPYREPAAPRRSDR